MGKFQKSDEFLISDAQQAFEKMFSQQFEQIVGKPEPVETTLSLETIRTAQAKLRGRRPLDPSPARWYRPAPGTVVLRHPQPLMGLNIVA